MPYDETLAARVLESVAGRGDLAELTMFGGWGVTLFGNMAVGVMGDDLIVRVGPAAFEDSLARPGARPFDFTGRPMKGWVYVDGAAVRSAKRLDEWVSRGAEFALSLPPKHGAKPTKKTTTSTPKGRATRPAPPRP